MADVSISAIHAARAAHPVAHSMARSTSAPRSDVRWALRRATASGAIPPLTPRRQLTRAIAIAVVVAAVSMLAHLGVVSRLQYRASQHELFAALRLQLGEGTAPTGPVDFEGNTIDPGSPVAILEIPEIGLSTVVVHGTSAGELMRGPGQRRDTPLPGQVGTSVLLGRNAAYGAPFGRIDQLEAGDEIEVTTANGVFDYVVSGVRQAGDPLPVPLTPGSSRIVLTTAGGRALLPSSVVRVDAEIVGDPVVGQPPLLRSSTLPDSEQAMGTDRGTLWVLVLWMQALLAIAVAAVWAWHRWGRVQAWICCTPPLALVGLATSAEIIRLLPNLL